MDSLNTQDEQTLAPEYETPVVEDYGTLVDLTLGGTLQNADVPGGVDNAFS